MRVLVTGGAGFFGSKLVEKLLDANHIVTVYDNLYFGDDGIKPFLNHSNYIFVKGDITDYQAIENTIFKNDIIVHMAAFVGEPLCKKHKETVYDVNTDATKFIADVCKKINKKLIFLSTCSNYGKNENVVYEESELNPLGLYSDSKIKAEKYIIENLNNFLILRCSTLFGVSYRMRFDLTINQFLYEIFNYAKISVFGEFAWRPFIHVDDASTVILNILETELIGVFNLGSNELNFTKKQIVDTLYNSGLRFQTEYVSFDDPRDYKVNFDKLLKIIDFKPKFNLPDGINQIIQYLRLTSNSSNEPPEVSLRTGFDCIIDEDCIFKRPYLVTIGNHVAIDKGFYCTTSLKIGDYVHISPYVTCLGGEKGEFICKGFNNIMAGARIICSSDRFDDSGLFGSMIPSELKGRQMTKPVIMEEFSNIGTNSVVLPGSILRKGVLLAAGSLLIGDTEEWGIYKGNPAVLVKKISGKKIEELANRV